MLAVKQYFPNGDLAETINIGRFPSRTAARQSALDGKAFEALRRAWLPAHSSGYCEVVYNGAPLLSITDRLDTYAQLDADEARRANAPGF